MVSTNKTVLEKANAAVSAGDYEGFLSFCTDDTIWTFVGDRTLNGKEEVRQYMKEVYIQPPVFTVENLIAEGAFVTAVGSISLKEKDGSTADFSYCDVWEFRDGKMLRLKAFVV